MRRIWNMYYIYGVDTIGQMHRDVDWRLQSYSTCQLRKEVLWVCTHCKVESWSANWWKIARCYGLVISCMSGPFRSFCRYQAHSIHVQFLYIYAGSKVDKGVDNLNVMVSTDTLEGGVEVSSKTCNFVLLKLISSPICKDSSCSISRARTSISNMLASKGDIICIV